jgi:hypothetical protein
MMAQVEVDGVAVTNASFHFVRHSAANETVLCSPASERATLSRIVQHSSRFGTKLETAGEVVRIAL